MPSIRFRLDRDRTALLGEIHRPVADVMLWSPADNAWRKVKMLIDTGADYTLLPKYIATWLQIDLSKAKTYDTIGVGGQQKVTFLEKVKVKIGAHEREIPIGVINSTKVPPLMGRHLFFETFKVTFNKHSFVEFTD